MRQHRSFRVVTAALAAAAAGLASAVVTLPAAAADTVVASVDFEDGTYAPFVQSGDATLTVIDDGTGTNQVLNVAGRANDYDGIQTAPSALTPGETYRLTADVRLAPGTDGTANMRLVGVPGYDWFSSDVPVTAASWTTLTGTFTVPADADAADAKVYIGTDDIAPAADAYDYQIDNVELATVAVEPPPTANTVLSADFEDGTTGALVQSGDPTLAVIDLDGGKALSVTDRVNTWDTVETPTGIFEPDVEYTLSMRIRLAPGTDGSGNAHFTVAPAYTWVGATPGVTADAWTTVSATYTLPADADPLTVKAFIEVDAIGGVLPDFIVDDVLITSPIEGISLEFDFEDGLQGWAARGDSAGDPVVNVTTAEAHGGEQAAIVTERDSQGDGIKYDFTEVFEVGQTYDITAWVKMADGGTADSIWLSAHTATDGTDAYGTVGQFDNIRADGWTQVTASYTVPNAELVELYFETSYNGGGNGDFLVDDITVASRVVSWDPSLTPLKDTVDFPIGVAIDSRETVGAPSELLLHHFDQVTHENFMKVEAWYDAERNFRMNPEAITVLDFAQANDLRVYGHTLVWHSQTPDWFFQDENGEFLTEADYDEMDERLRTHIFNVAEAISAEYGEFGSETNPVVAFDVVNEVISDQATPDGLRTSYWHDIMGADFISQAFIYADEAFNETYAVDDAVEARPVTLFINDYNTEQAPKGARLHTLVSDLLDAEVPVDGVGHQFHVALSMPVENLQAALERFEDLEVIQAVTELDVTVGTPVTTPAIIEQGYYLRDAFRVFRAFAEDLYSVTIWGLTDNRSWRSEQAPLLFDDSLAAKPAYFGAIDGDLEPRIRTGNVFAGSVELTDDAADALEWSQLPLHAVGEVADFQLRWAPDHLTAYVTVSDATDTAADEVTFVVGEETYTVGREGPGDVDAVVDTTASGYTVVAHLPLTDAAQGDSLDFDVQVADGATTVGWGDEGATGSITLVEALSYLEVAHASAAPTIDGDVDSVWTGASAVVTGKAVQGASGATATVKTLWRDHYLYVLMDVADPNVDVTGSDPWIQDSVEIYVDAANAKNGSYRYDDTQIRISAENVVTVGTGDETYQLNRLDSAVTETATGYRVEAAIDLLEYGGLGTFHGLDFQVNDATNGARTSIRNWADPTGNGYQSTARWGVGQLVEDVQWPFTDVRPGHPFLTEIQWMWDSGLTRGYADGTFRGMGAVNRDAMAAFLYRLVNDGATAPACTAAPFTDVTTSHPFCGEIAWLKSSGITTGYADGTFRPAAPVSRDAMAAFLYRIENGPAKPAAPATAPFKDVPVSHPFAGEISWLKTQGLAGGWSDGTFRPSNAIERQAMAAFLYRGVVQKGMFGELWEPPTEFVPGGAVNPTASQVSTARPVEGNANVAALTFDDGPMYATDTNRLLDFLEENDVKAVFCVIGQNITAPGGAELLQRMVADGHTLCNHSTSYAGMASMTADQVEADLLANLDIIREALGDPNAPVPYFRAPNGEWGQTEQVAADLGMQPLGLGNVINDWEDAVQADLTQLETNLNNAITPGAVVLVHVGGGSSRANSVDATINVVTDKLADGWDFTLPQGGIPDPAPVIPAPVNGMRPV